MKQVILATMAVLALSGPASATSGWDYFWGTTLNPQNTGWNDFWYQCQDPTKTVGDCIGTLAVGTVAVLAIPIVIAGAGILAVSAVPATTTIAGIPITVVTTGPVMGF